MSNGSFSLNKFYRESKKTLFRPKAYFTAMETTGGWGEPVLKALLYGVIAGIFILIWSLLDVIGVTTGVFSGNVGVVGFFGTIIGAVIGVFIVGLIILILSSLCKGNKNYQANSRVAAAIMIIVPVNAVLGFFSGISYGLGVIISMIINLYGVYMLYAALTLTLKGNQKSAKAVAYILGALVVVITIIGLFL